MSSIIRTSQKTHSGGEKTPQSVADTGGQNHHLHHHKERIKDIHCRNIDPKNSPANTLEEHKNDIKKDISNKDIKSCSTTLADHENTRYSVRKAATRQDGRRILKDLPTNYASELHNAVIDLNHASSKINRSLDDTYYSILEKFTSLQSTIMSLKELAAMTRQLNVGLVSECHKVAHESNRQLDSFDDFKEQSIRIQNLRKRVDIGRHNFLCLVKRIRDVRKRVEDWESSERERQHNTRRRLKIFWSFTGATLVIVILLYLIFWWMDRQAYGKSLDNRLSMQTGEFQVNKLTLQDMVNTELFSESKTLRVKNNQYSGNRVNGRRERSYDEL